MMQGEGAADLLVMRNAAMRNFLFVAKPDTNPASIRDGHRTDWSCSAEAKKGDRAMVYITGGIGIAHEWTITSNARKDGQYYRCGVRFIRDIDPPINIRQRRLREANPKPEQVATVQSSFRRNPDVIAEVLYRANGKCERCKERAPFKKRASREPYLEVHHRIRLADGGDDTIENAIALCPNCHRHEHYA